MDGDSCRPLRFRLSHRIPPGPSAEMIDAAGPACTQELDPHTHLRQIIVCASRPMRRRPRIRTNSIECHSHSLGSQSHERVKRRQFHARPSWRPFGGEFGSAMTLTRSRESHGRKAVFLLVLLSHCALILLISRSNNSQKSATKILHAPLLVFFIDSTKSKTGSDAAKEPSPVIQQTVSKRRNTESPNTPSGPTER